MSFDVLQVSHGNQFSRLHRISKGHTPQSNITRPTQTFNLIHVISECLKVSKSCYFFQKVAEKLLNFQKVAEKLPKLFCFSYLFWVLKIKNSYIASYQNFICQSPMIISEVLSISLDQQIVYQNDMNKTWLYTHITSRTL